MALIGDANLENAYRRLLAWYPRSYRSEYEEEMIAVLLASADQGRVRPGLAESANLISGAVRARLRRVHAAGSGQSGRDALAAFSIVAPALVAVALIVVLAVHIGSGHSLPPHRVPLPRLLYQGALRVTGTGALALAVIGQVLVAAVALLRWRFAALAVVVATMVTWVSSGSFRPVVPIEAFLMWCFAFEGLSLALSPGPRRGAQLLTRKSAAAVAATATFFGLTWAWTFGADGRIEPALKLGVAAAALMGLVLVVFLSPRPVRPFLALLLSAMLYPYALYAGQLDGITPVNAALRITLLYLPSALVGVAVALWSRGRMSHDYPTGR